MRKISRAEEQYNSLNFRTADAEPWGQKEHFRVVDNDTPLTEGGPKCEGCGGKMQEHGEGSVCRNRRCNKRDMVINASKTASDKPYAKEASVSEALNLLTPAAIVAQPFIMDKINKHNDKKRKQKEPEEQKEPEDFDGKYATEKEASLADMAHNVVTHLPTVIPAVAAEAAAVTGLVKTIKKNRNKPAPATGSDEAYNATGFMSPSQVQNYKNKDAVEKNSSFDERYANEKIANQYIKKQGDSWVITQKGTGKVLSHHDSEEKANAAFAAMMANKHGSVEHTCDVGDHKVHEDVRCVTPDCEHRGKSWESDGHQDWDHDYACGEHFTEGTTAGIAKNHDDDSDWRNRYSDLDSDW